MLRASSIDGAQDLLDSLRFLLPATRLEPGCRRCTAWIGEDCTVHYDEVWATEPDARRRVCSSSFTSLLGLMECASEPPDVRFDFASPVATAVRGLDYVAQVRAEAEEIVEA